MVTRYNRLTEAVSTSTHILCFGAKIKVHIPLHTPGFEGLFIIRTCFPGEQIIQQAYASSFVAVPVHESHYGGGGTVLLHDVDCNGNETSLDQCPSLFFGSKYCWKSVGLRCLRK